VFFLLKSSWNIGEQRTVITAAYLNKDENKVHFIYSLKEHKYDLGVYLPDLIPLSLRLSGKKFDILARD
jgi:hypothetical protein